MSAASFNSRTPETNTAPPSGRVWSATNRDYKRKFMQFQGEWIDEDNNRHSGNLRAWGQREPESKLVCKLDLKNGERHHPNYLWKP